MLTLKTFNSPIEAHLLKSKLESEGISCFVADENMIMIEPRLNYSMGGIKLKVSKVDWDKANEILADLEITPYVNSKEEAVICPVCKSNKIDNDFKSFEGVKGFFVLLSSLFLPALSIAGRLDYYCKDCKHVF